MSSSDYGNVPWQYYVYGCYVIVLLCVGGFHLMALRLRRAALQNLQDEGFLGDENEVE